MKWMLIGCVVCLFGCSLKAEQIAVIEMSSIQESVIEEAIIEKDITPPVIVGAEEDFTVVENEYYCLEEIIKAFDETDGQVEVEFVGDWNSHRAGVYPIKAVAKDQSGNVSEVAFHFVTIRKEVPTTISVPQKSEYSEVAEYIEVSESMIVEQPFVPEEVKTEEGCSFKMWDSNQSCDYVNFDAYQGEEYFQNDVSRAACNLKGQQLLEEGKINNYMCEDVLANDGHYWGSALHTNW